MTFHFAWREDLDFHIRGCAPLWAWTPHMQQCELFPGMELAGTEYDEGDDGETVHHVHLSDR